MESRAASIYNKMKEFMDEDFLLETKTAQHLYHEYAAEMPIVDYHCHLSAKEIYEDRRFDDLGQVWLGGCNPDGTYFGDHYKWRLMRANGITEEEVTGIGSGFQRFEAFAGTLSRAIGNPMYHWCHLELRKYFGFQGYLSPRNAREVWDLCNEKLRTDPELTARGLIRQSNVAFIGTTDDPTDSLKWHEKIAADLTISFSVCPSFRPDMAININQPGFAEYMTKLAGSVGKEHLDSVEEVCAALTERLDFFHKHGCRAADHALQYIMFRPETPDQANAVYHKALAGEVLTREEAEIYQTAVLLHMGRAYHRLNMAMQIHYACLRDVNEKMYQKMGPNTGYDMIGNAPCGESAAAFLNALNETDECPKTIFYSLNAVDQDQISTLIGCFQSGLLPGKMQLGSAWWFNDTKSGMEAQLRSLANLGVLGNFVGMLTDSRSFLSYTRHEYFRRILCNLIGNWVENGEYPDDEDALREIVQGICYHNAARYFAL